MRPEYQRAAVLNRVPGTLTHMTESMPLAATDVPLQSLVRRAANQHERITFTDNDHPAAVLISATELEDLEDALAVAQSRLQEATGTTVRIPHDEARQRLGLNP